MWLSSGRHCWQVVLLAPCDLVWLGVGDGSLAPDVWGEQLSCCLQPAAELWQCMEFV
jgi:hypothetical protein